MSKIAIYDITGKIVRTVQCPDDEAQNQVGDGEYLYHGEAELHDSIQVETKTLVKGVKPVKPAPPPPPAQYVVDRKKAYPTVEKQLDMFWHAMDSGSYTKLEPWYSQIKAIKELHPKAPNGANFGGDTEEL